MPETCPRCGATLPVIDARPAPFCASCGLPQLRVSADVIVSPNGDASTDALQTPSPSSTDEVKLGGGDAVRWRTALPATIVAAFAALAPALIFPGALALGGAGGICLLLLPLASLGAVAFYGRAPRSFPTGARIGGRIGATTGLLLGLMVAAATGAAGFFLRYGKHSLAVESLLTQSINQAVTQLRTSSTTPLPQDTALWLQAPEVHAGWFIALQLFLALLFIGLGALFGAFGGSLLHARRERISKARE